ncbi:MAG TPA: exodeoxyribonuclease VII large subunit [Acidimicrobiales bacterium]
MAPGVDDEMVGEHADALSIAGLYGEVETALSNVFPRGRQLWVRGEVHSVSDQQGRTGHCYLDLIDPETAGERQAPVLRVKCWRTTWGPLRATLQKEGIELQPGMVVVIRGTLDFYRPRAEVGFILAELDVTALLGRLAAQRAALLRTLAAEGLLERNRAQPVPPVPLRVGLVASPGTEGFRDFVGQLSASGFSFRVAVAPATVQGADAPRSIARALTVLARRADEVDLIAVVRGGGSKGDLAAFDAEPVARAVAGSPVPVWTGIGHTGDESVADLVANRSCITPTECGREIVQRVSRWWAEAVVEPAERVAGRAADALAAAEHHNGQGRARLAATARHLVERQAAHLAARVDSVTRCAPRWLDDAHASLAGRATRLGPLALAHVEHGVDRLDGWRRLLAAYDVDRQLERGYTLTIGADGQVLRGIDGLATGDELVTRFADGSVRSAVRSVDSAVPR